LNLRTKAAIAKHFLELISQTQLRLKDSLIYGSHRSSIDKRLRRVFTTNRIQPIGSSSRGTSVRNVSDIDLMLVLNVKEVRWGDRWVSSDTVLKNVRGQLQGRYTTTEVERDGEAIVVNFADGTYPVDIVPAVYTHSAPVKFSATDIKNYPVFKIPDGEGDWMFTSPLTHTRYLQLQNTRSRGKLYNVVRLLKFWRSCRNPDIPLNSFHIELLLASQEICIGAKSYSQCLYSAFAELNSRECRALQDPMSISGLVKAANTDAKRACVQDAIDFSLRHAGSALDAEDKGDTVEALRQWDIVFNSQFSK
jgi:hypothetical protein